MTENEDLFVTHVKRCIWPPSWILSRYLREMVYGVELCHLCHHLHLCWSLSSPEYSLVFVPVRNSFLSWSIFWLPLSVQALRQAPNNYLSRTWWNPIFNFLERNVQTTVPLVFSWPVSLPACCAQRYHIVEGGRDEWLQRTAGNSENQPFLPTPVTEVQMEWGRTDGETNGRTDGQTGERTDGRRRGRRTCFSQDQSFRLMPVQRQRRHRQSMLPNVWIVNLVFIYYRG